jgi:PPOX class probable F420-dependent enzyme
MSLQLDVGLDIIRQRAEENSHLAVVITIDGTSDPQVSMVNATIIEDPASGESVVAFVARSGAKLRNLRRHPRATLFFKAGWEWVAVKGPVSLSGPDDPDDAISASAQRDLLRLIYERAGGQHHDLDEYDRMMHAERRCAVLLTPERIWTNPPGSEHKEPEDRASEPEQPNYELPNYELPNYELPGEQS